jgi:hypothetical protein
MWRNGRNSCKVALMWESCQEIHLQVEV